MYPETLKVVAALYACGTGFAALMSLPLLFILDEPRPYLFFSALFVVLVSYVVLT